jgi:TadE-like protein
VWPSERRRAGRCPTAVRRVRSAFQGGRSRRGAPRWATLPRRWSGSLGDGGYVTAETAVVLPILVLFTGMLMWGVLAAAAQIRCVDAARAGARAAARSEPLSAVLRAARESAPRGARVRSSRAGDLVRVEVSADALGPGALAALLSAEVHSSASALAEDTVEDAP